MNQDSAQKSKRSGSTWRSWSKTRKLFALLLVGGATFALVMLLCYGILAGTYDLKAVGQVPERSLVYDVTGKFYSRLRGENRMVVPLTDVKPFFIKALLAREDSRFYKHPGVDLYGVARATVRNVVSLSFKEGGSTLTQQLARNSFALGGRTLHRKLLEAMMALRIERHYSKEEILEAYINRIYFGSGVYGLETASQIYFDKPCSELSMSEAALLVGLIPSPNRFSPFNNLKAALAQRDRVLDRVASLKIISPKEAAAAKNAHVTLAPKSSLGVQDNYAMDAVYRVINLILTPEDIDRGGLKVYITIDPKLQEIATSALQLQLDAVEKRKGYSHITKNAFTKRPHDPEAPTEYLQGALVAIDNRTGGICAIVGGRDYRQSKYNRALQARRQVGSAFKPFVYAAAFEKGLHSDTPISDSPLGSGEITASGKWQPANSDGQYYGDEPAEYGLIHSRNTMSVRVGNLVGLGRIHDVAAIVGICNDIPKVPSSYLGAFEASPKDLTSAYTIFPNRGVLKSSYLISRVEDSDGQILFETVPSQHGTLERDAVETTSEILEKVLDIGTAASARSLGFERKAGGKTGTTNLSKDAWFVGYTRSLTCGVWVGFDIPKPIMEHGYGSTLALPIWVSFMNRAPEERYPSDSFGNTVKDVGDEIGDIFSKIGRSIGNLFGGEKKD